MMTHTMSAAKFEAWLERYRAAWEGRDPRAAAELFTADAEYYWTPFDPPQRGRAEIAAAWEGAVNQQKDVQFTSEVLAVAGATGIARWHAKLTAVPSGDLVQLDGVLVAEFADDTRCRVFREWWHSIGRPY